MTSDAAYQRVMDREGATLAPEQRKVVENALRDFRLAGVALPAESKAALDRDRFALENPAGRRRMLGDGNFHGLYQRPDAEMLALWEVAVAETRTVIADGWRTAAN